MAKALYIAYFAGVAGQSIGLFYIGDGILAGIDVGAMRYNGTLASLPDGTLAGDVEYVLPANTPSITGAAMGDARGGMRWTLLARDERATGGRPKSRYPGASPCARFFKRFGAAPTLSPRKRKSGNVPSSGDGPKGRSPGVFAEQAVKTIVCGTPDVAA